MKKIDFLKTIKSTDKSINIGPCEFLQGVVVKKKKPFNHKLSSINTDIISNKIKKTIKINLEPDILKKIGILDESIDILNKLLDDDFYYIEQKIRDSFVSSVLTLLDDDFHTLNLGSRIKSNKQEIYINKVKQKLAIDLIKNKLYRKFNYHHSHSFKKSRLENNLQEGNIVGDNEMRYFGDYFDLNILLLEVDKNTIQLVREDLYQDKISIIIIVNNNKYYPVLSNTGNHFIHPSSLKKLLSKFRVSKNEKKTGKKTKKQFKTLELSDKSYKQNKLSLYNIVRYTLKDLQEIAENYDIETTKLKANKKGQKLQKPKTKKELYDIIKLKHSV